MNRVAMMFCAMVAAGPIRLLPAQASSALSPRQTYNVAREAFEKGDLEAADRQFTDARNRAGSDAELRFRCAFNLAMTAAARADGVEKEKPDDAIESLRHAAAWFRDAVRLRPDDPDARQNLEIVLRRIQSLANQVNRGKNGLEARLDRLIDDQRSLRDDIRGLMAGVDAAGGGSEPLGFQSAFRSAAGSQRTLLADAGTVGGMAAEEAGRIEATPEEKRSDPDRARLIQLRNLEVYLHPAGERMADAEYALHRLQGDTAHRKADEALRDLKRAREQLLDPVAVLKGIAHDQAALLSHTVVLAAPPSLRAGEEKHPGPPPAWLNCEFLKDGEEDARQRLGEVQARLEAGLSRQTAGESAETAPASAAERGERRLLEAVREALPHLKEASASMEAAAASLTGGSPGEARLREEEALEALFRAIERFSGIRELIELAHAEQQGVVGLLSPPAPGEEAQEPPLTTEERSTRVGEAAVRNGDRLLRLEGLFADETAALQEKKGDAGRAGPSEEGGEEAAKAIDQELTRYSLAEAERKAAAAAIDRLQQAVDGAGEAPLPLAKEAAERIENLRRLFFSIAEHLEELIRRQTETHDRTASAAAEREEEKRLAVLGPLGGEQKTHAGTAREIGRALDEMASRGGGPDPSGRDTSQAFAQAAAEVNSAAGKMDSGVAELDRSPVDAEKTLTAQKEALEHLMTALLLLKPPKQDESKSSDPQQQDPEQMSREQASRRLQAVREREAERRRRQRDRAAQGGNEPVEKDW